VITVPNRVVFDAEPLIARADDEPESDVVEAYLDAVAVEDTAGYVSCVNLTEIRDTLARKYDRSTADNYLDWLDELGIETRDAEAVWVGASEYILTYNPALGDSFALATAENLNATLLIGGDDDHDDVSDVPIERFRDGST
jgi:PIN domain.